MGGRGSVPIQEQEWREIQKETGFDNSDMKRLYSRFVTIDRSGNGRLTKDDFMHISSFAINPIAPRILHLFFHTDDEEMRELDSIDFNQFMRTMARFRRQKSNGDNIMNSRREKLKFAFKMYDIDNDKRLSRSELIDLIRMMVGSNIAEDQIGSMADRMIVEADEDCDGFISFDEFVKSLATVNVEENLSIRYM